MENQASRFDPASPSGSPLPATTGNVTAAPSAREEQIRWHIDQLEDLSAELNHDHAWTPFSRRLFLATLATSGKVIDACTITGLHRAGAYALRNRDRTFAAGWDAAAAIARDILADRLAEQALDGITDTLTRADGVTISRHRFDTRLSIAVLHRLDKRADRAVADIAAPSGARAAWDPFLAAIGNGDEAAATAIAFPPPPEPRILPPNISPQRLACLKLRSGEFAHLTPTQAVALMQSIKDGSFEAENDRLAAEADEYEDDEDEIDLSNRIWTNDDGTFTDFPPPPGFDSWQSGRWGDKDYHRFLTDEEEELYEALMREDTAAEKAERAENRSEDDDLRRLFFGYEVVEVEEDSAEESQEKTEAGSTGETSPDESTPI